jgi:hypothetical protein
VAYDWKTELPGIVSHHADSCPVRDGGECTCGPLGYRASVRDWDTNERLVSPVLQTTYEAVEWQRENVASAPSPSPSPRVAVEERGQLGALIDEFLQATEDGLVRRDDGARYTREEVRELRGALSYVDSELGSMDVQEVRRRHVQALLDQLRGSGVPPARVSAIADAIRSLYTYAIRRDIVGFSPAVELELRDTDVPTMPASANGAGPEWPAFDQRPAPPASANGAGPEWPAADQRTPPPAVGPPWTPPPASANGAGPEWPAPDQRTPPPGVGPPWTPPPFPGSHVTPPGSHPTPQPYPTPSYPYGYPTWYPPQPAPTRTSGPLSAIMGSPGPADADYDSTMQERWLWWTVRIIVIVFVLIALVLVAESV